MKKNRVTYLLIIGLFVVYVLLIIVAFANLNNYSAANAALMPEITVVIDAGHGGEDGGAVANGIVEKDINLSVARKLRDLCRLSGFKTVMTRDSDIMLDSDGETIRQRKVNDMKKRLEIYNSSPNNVVISIHQNKFTVEKYRGAQTFYSPNNPDSEALAGCVQKNIVSFIQPDNQREIKKAGKEIYLLYNAQAPSVIVECGFLSNAEEAELLKDEKYQTETALAVFSGLMEYYNN